jgi:hypothetical protein
MLPGCENLAPALLYSRTARRGKKFRTALPLQTLLKVHR